MKMPQYNVLKTLKVTCGVLKSPIMILVSNVYGKWHKIVLKSVQSALCGSFRRVSVGIQSAAQDVFWVSQDSSCSSEHIHQAHYGAASYLCSGKTIKTI